MQFEDVKVVVTEIGDHYSPDDRSVALTKDKFDGKTLTSIVIAHMSVATRSSMRIMSHSFLCGTDWLSRHTARRSLVQHYWRRVLLLVV